MSGRPSWFATLPAAFLVFHMIGPAAVTAAEVETSKPIKLMHTNSSDTDFISRVFGGILREVGYNVEFVNIDYIAHYTALETGDLHLSTGVWDSTGWDILNDLVSGGKIVNFGSIGVEIREGWWYPAYLTESCPGLPSWEALKSEECVRSLATAETAPSARYVDAPVDWGTGAQELIEEKGLDFEVISAGSAIALITTLKSAVKAKESIIGWGYTPHWFIDNTQGGFVDFGGYAGNGFVWKLGNKELMSQVPIASRLLHLYALPTEAVADAMDRIDNGGESLSDVSQEWVTANRATWKAWLR